jgi:hypothetical protein
MPGTTAQYRMAAPFEAGMADGDKVVCIDRVKSARGNAPPITALV